jgi:tetratricopeptide (TPR) repeat protein
LLGRNAEEMVQMKKAYESDPLLIQVNNDYAFSLALNGRSEEGLARIQKSKEMDPDMCGTPVYAALILRHIGKVNEAIKELQSPIAQDWCSGGWGKSELGYSYGIVGKKMEAEKLLQELKEASKTRYVPCNYIAMVYLGMGDYNQAAYWLEKGIDDGSLWLGDLEAHLPELFAQQEFDRFLQRTNLK